VDILILNDVDAATLPGWRYRLRQHLIPIVRWETPYLALLQSYLRTPMLDSYFAFTANLGTHTFFMIALPICFWFGYTRLGLALANLLAFGVIVSGVVKDLVCLPRPLSPPLQRITMSGSAALEYGFPSTHSTNAISVVVYALYLLKNAEGLDENARFWTQTACYAYAVSIIFGRLYCGMHGFFDVIIGSVLGAAIAGVQIAYGDTFHQWLWEGPYVHPLIGALVMLAIVRLHPEPADDCPCFDDSVAFSGVVIGAYFAAYTFPRTTYSVDYPVPGTTPYSFEEIGLVKTILRVLAGVVTIFIWRAIMKPFLFKVLPPIFRIIEKLGADLPRTFFLKASQYKSIPELRKDDNVIPSARDIPQIIGDVRQRRGRAVSVGPQSAADAYEQIAYRQEQRRRSLSKEREAPLLPEIKESDSPPKENHDPTQQQLKAKRSGYFSNPLSETPPNKSPSAKSARPPPLNFTNLPTPLASRVQSYDQISSSPTSFDPLLTPPLSELDPDHMFGGVSPIARLPSETEEFPFYDLAEKEFLDERRREEEEIFGKIERVRVRYDVEVVTKLVVYAGIAFLAVQGCPVGFEVMGLGMGVGER
jgi:membrane-associated phospholipid phosphatase